jgi:hypothetical protein
MPTLQNFIPYLLLSLVLLPIFFLQDQLVEAIVLGIDHCTILSCDFRRHYLPQTQNFVLEKNTFVSGWFYPPLLVILLYPFHGITSPEIWWSVLLLTVALSLVYTTHKYSKSTLTYPSSFFLVCISLPVIHCIKWGQISLVIAVGLIIALNTRDRFSGLILGFLGALKIYPLRWGHRLLFLDCVFLFYVCLSKLSSPTIKML